MNVCLYPNLISLGKSDLTEEINQSGNPLPFPQADILQRLPECHIPAFFETQRGLCVYLIWRLGISSSSNKTGYPFTATLRAAERGSAYHPSPKAEEIGNYRRGWPIIAAVGIDYSSLCEQTFIVASWV